MVPREGMRVHMKCMPFSTDFVAKLGEPRIISGVTYFPIIYDDLSGGIETAKEIYDNFYEVTDASN